MICMSKDKSLGNANSLSEHRCPIWHEGVQVNLNLQHCKVVFSASLYALAVLLRARERALCCVRVTKVASTQPRLRVTKVYNGLYMGQSFSHTGAHTWTANIEPYLLELWCTFHIQLVIIQRPTIYIWNRQVRSMTHNDLVYKVYVCL